MCKFCLGVPILCAWTSSVSAWKTQALALDMLGEHSEHWTFFEKQLTLRAQLYATPTSHLDHAMTSVKCVRMMF